MTERGRRRCTHERTTREQGSPAYFVIENETVFEMDLMPDGAAGSNVTNAE